MINREKLLQKVITLQKKKTNKKQTKNTKGD